MSSTSDFLKCLLYGNGANGSPTITDSSKSPLTITNLAPYSVYNSTTQNKFGSASLRYKKYTKITEVGTTTTNVKITAHGLSNGNVVMIDVGGYVERTVTVVDADNFTITALAGLTNGTTVLYAGNTKTKIDCSSGQISISGDWTINFWIRCPTSAGFTTNLFSFYDSGDVKLGSIDVVMPGIVAIISCNDALSDGDLSTTGTWYHVEITQSSGTIRVFLNGVLGSTTAAGYSSTVSYITMFDVGISGADDIYLDDVQIWSGLALHTASFTAPTSEYVDNFNLSVASETLDVELTANCAQVASEALDVELTIPNVSIADVSIQVEVIEVIAPPIPPGVGLYDGPFYLEVLEYQSTESAEAGTDTANIAITGHGLDTKDMIVNTTRRLTDIGRGSRPVYSGGTTANNIALEVPIPLQTVGDSIRLYKYIDRTDLVLIKTIRLSRRLSGLSELSLTIKTDKDYLIRAGQYVRLAYVSGGATYYYFNGNVQNVKRKLAAEDNTVIFQEIQCVGMSQIPSRRTIQLTYPAGTVCGDIVTDMVDDYLHSEGIRKSTINNGAALDEDWQADIISISEVLDQCASKSGYQWFVGDDGLLSFYQDPSSVLEEEAIVDGGTFTDYKNLEFTETTNNYTNKIFVEGGFDERGNPIIINSQDTSEVNNMQDICAGTGVYGYVQRDSNITESNYVTAEVGTTTTNINYTSHGQAVGDMVWNVTRNLYRTVTAVVDANNFTVDSVASQASGDTIAFFDQANDIISNYVKKQGFLPAQITFVTRYLEYAPGNKLNVNLEDYGIPSTYYLVESVDIIDTGGVTGSFVATVKCNLRKTSDFSTQRSGNYLDYFGGF